MKVIELIFIELHEETWNECRWTKINRLIRNVKMMAAWRQMKVSNENRKKKICEIEQKEKKNDSGDGKRAVMKFTFGTSISESIHFAHINKVMSKFTWNNKQRNTRSLWMAINEISFAFIMFYYSNESSFLFHIFFF